MEPMSIRIGKALYESGVVNRVILEKALRTLKEEKNERKRRLQQILIEDFNVDRHAIFSAISRLYAFKEINLRVETVDDSQLDFIRKTLDSCSQKVREALVHKRVLPFSETSTAPKILTVIAADPLDREIPVMLRDLPYKQIEVAYAPIEQIEELTERVMAFKNEFLQQIEVALQSIEGTDDEDTDIDEAALDAEINRSMLTNLIEGMLVEATRKGASDIHVVPKEGNVTDIYMRVDGKLQLWHAISSLKPESVAAVIKDRSMNIDRFNRNIAQDGYIQRRIDNHHIRFRVSVLPIAGSEVQRKFESVVIRVLDDRKVITDFDKLGLQEQARRDFIDAISKPNGLIILTGPTGSGKSTTLIAALHYIMDPSKNVVSVEQPVEYLIRGARQIKLSHKLDFDGALRAVLRHDPDIVMVGEVRDLKSAEIAVSLANTGHVTFTTLHTNDAPSAVARLYMLGVEPFLIANAINLVVAQRLVRKLCEHCKRPAADPDVALARHLGFTEDEIEATTFYDAVGCDKCFEGYRGRQSIVEALSFTHTLRKIILTSKDFIDEELIRQEALANGMLSLRGSGRGRIMEGATTLSEIASATAE